MHSGRRARVAMLVVAALPCSVAAGARASEAVPTAVRTEPDYAHGRLLDKPAHGRRAVQDLADQVGTAAVRNRMTKARLQRLLLEDPTAWVDTRGRVFYVERGAAADPGTGSGLAPPARFPYADTFGLHSKPWAARKIFLDFDGGDVSGTSWNEADGLPDAVYPGFSVDDDDLTFTDTEQDVVQDVWARVSEDYAPFEVDVTTADPGDAGLRRSSRDDPSYGVQVLVTQSDIAQTSICKGSCAGIAYFNAFDRVHPDGGPRTDQPVWVFATSMGERSAAMADVVSHEVGHTVGLSHDGLGEQQYYPPGGMWSPIMGAGYTPLSQFSDGDYPGATNHENDLAVIAAHGARLVSDDHGDTPALATSLRPSQDALAGAPHATAAGTISTAGDQDVFEVIRDCDGPFEVDVTPAPSSPDLDVGLRLTDGRGAVVDATSPPAVPTGEYPDQAVSGLDAGLSITSAPAGHYYVEVDGVGQSDYGDYGSLGDYTVSIGGCVADPGPSLPGRPLGLDVHERPTDSSAELTWRPPRDDGGSPITGYEVLLDGNQVGEVSSAAGSYNFSGLVEKDHLFAVRAVNGNGLGAAAQTHRDPVLPPSEPQRLAVTSYGLEAGRARVSWAPPAQLNGNATVSYWVRWDGVAPSRPAGPVFDAGRSLSIVLDGLVESSTYSLEAWAVGGEWLDGRHTRAVRFTYHQPRAPGSARISQASPGARGGRATARARWRAPLSDGGAPVRSYDVTALRMSRSGAVLHRKTVTVGASARGRTMRLARGRYRFVVKAVNLAGASRTSDRSNLVRAR